MAKTSMQYDHPVYTTPYVYAGGTTVGANGLSTKFAAFTAQKIKAVQYSANVVGTSSTTPLLFTKSGTATATTTLTAIASAATNAVDFALSTAVTLAAGDQFWVSHGTDATIAISASIETLVIPGANVTA
jgi:hypothetical protein